MFEDFKQSLDQAAWLRIGVAVAIAVLLSSIIMLAATTHKGAYDAQIQELKANVTAVRANMTGFNENVTDLTSGLATTRAQLTAVSDTVTANQNDISTLASRANDADSRISVVENNLTALASPPDVYLTGTFGNYTIHAKADEAGNYSIDIHLGYSIPVSVGNVTTYDEAISAFYEGINWTEADIPDCVPALTYNSTDWGISQIMFNAGIYDLEANTETIIPLMFGGLSSNYTADFAYAEIYKVVQ